MPSAGLIQPDQGRDRRAREPYDGYHPQVCHRTIFMLYRLDQGQEHAGHQKKDQTGEAGM